MVVDDANPTGAALVLEAARSLTSSKKCLGIVLAQHVSWTYKNSLVLPGIGQESEIPEIRAAVSRKKVAVNKCRELLKIIDIQPQG